MTNLERALTAEDCLNHFIALTGPDLSMEEAAGDLIANIGHYCKAHGLDYLAIVKTGIGHWTIEQDDPDSIDALPDVTIAIDDDREPSPPAETVITISKEAHDRLLTFYDGPMDLSLTTINADGSVSFPVPHRTLRNLANIHPDVELAVRIITGLKTN